MDSWANDISSTHILYTVIETFLFVCVFFLYFIKVPNQSDKDFGIEIRFILLQKKVKIN